LNWFYKSKNHKVTPNKKVNLDEALRLRACPDGKVEIALHECEEVYIRITVSCDGANEIINKLTLVRDAAALMNSQK